MGLIKGLDDVVVSTKLYAVRLVSKSGETQDEPVTDAKGRTVDRKLATDKFGETVKVMKSMGVISKDSEVEKIKLLEDGVVINEYVVATDSFTSTDTPPDKTPKTTTTPTPTPTKEPLSVQLAKPSNQKILVGAIIGIGTIIGISAYLGTRKK